MYARTSLYSVILPLFALPMAGTMSTVALMVWIEAYSVETSLRSVCLSALSRVWVGVFLPRVITRRRARQELSSRTAEHNATIRARRRNPINSLEAAAKVFCQRDGEVCSCLNDEGS